MIVVQQPHLHYTSIQRVKLQLQLNKQQLHRRQLGSVNAFLKNRTSSLVLNVVLNFEQRPQCVVCSEVLANESMKPAKLKRHLETKHLQLKTKDESHFKRLATKLTSQQVDFQKYTTVNQKALQASFEVSFLIAKTKKPHNIGETLILPAAMKMVSIMQGEKYANVLKTIPLSSDTVVVSIYLLMISKYNL